MNFGENRVTQNYQQFNFAFIYPQNLESISVENVIDSSTSDHSQKNTILTFFEERNKSEQTNQNILKKQTINLHSESQYSETFSKQTLVRIKNQQKIRKKYKQNVQRNILTNIGNQLLTFLSNPKKSSSIYFQVTKDISSINQFYDFINKLRKRKKSPLYFNSSKFYQLFYPPSSTSEHYKTLRQMSLIFLQQLLPSFLLTSIRIKKQTKVYHISAARKLLRLLRYRKRNE